MTSPTRLDETGAAKHLGISPGALGILRHEPPDEKGDVGPPYHFAGTGLDAAIYYRTDELDAWLRQHPPSTTVSGDRINHPANVLAPDEPTTDLPASWLAEALRFFTDVTRLHGDPMSRTDSLLASIACSQIQLVISTAKQARQIAAPTTDLYADGGNEPVATYVELHDPQVCCDTHYPYPPVTQPASQ